jgi:hypothetical protein
LISLNFIVTKCSIWGFFHKLYVPTAALAASIRQLLANPLSSAVTREALSMLRTLFGTPAATGSLMAARATEGLEEAATITASCAALASDLLAEFTPPS